jgi:dimethylamine monooxygenase subunit A
MAVCLPSHWAPADKVGRPFAEVHAPVADNALLLQASSALMKLAAGGEAWERFVWNITDQPRLNAHPAHQRHDDQARWSQTAVSAAWFRSERQTFIPVPGGTQAVFTILVDVQPLAAVLHDAARTRALHEAIATMSPAVQAYRGLTTVHEPLLAWLQAHADALDASQ